jgi:anti-sigma regulatory factor (Ser/Thr protein kinase)
MPPDDTSYDGSELDVVASLRLDPVPAAARNARRFLEQFCRAAELPEEVCQTAALLVSELVTNAVLHGGTSATVEVHRPADILRVAVRDDNPDLPEVGLNPPLGQEGGRGLLIVSMLATRWGIEPAGTGKAVWFEVAVGPA